MMPLQPVTPLNFSTAGLDGLGCLDKLHFYTNQRPNHDYLQSTGKWAPHRIDGHYMASSSYSARGSNRGPAVTHWGKRSPKKQHWNGKVELNPSHYANLHDLIDDIRGIVPNLDEPEVCRLDFAVDFDPVQLSWRDIVKMIEVPGVKEFSFSIDQSSGEEYGASFGINPKRLHAYQHDVFDEDGEITSFTTRIEFQLSRDFCRRICSKLRDLSSVSTKSPFCQHKITFLNFNQNSFRRFDPHFQRTISDDESSPALEQILKNKQRWEGLRKLGSVASLYERYGYFLTRRFMNVDNNFDKFAQRDQRFVPSQLLSANLLDFTFQRDFSKWCSFSSVSSHAVVVGRIPATSTAAQSEA